MDGWMIAIASAYLCCVTFVYLHLNTHPYRLPHQNPLWHTEWFGGGSNALVDTSDNIYAFGKVKGSPTVIGPTTVSNQGRKEKRGRF